MEIAIAVLALLCLAMVVQLHRAGDLLERERSRAAEETRRSIELAHASLRNAPNADLIKLVGEHLCKYHLLTDRALEAAMSISDEYRTMVRNKGEVEVSAAIAYNAARKLAEGPFGHGPPGNNGRVRTGSEEIIEEQTA